MDKNKRLTIGALGASLLLLATAGCRGTGNVSPGSVEKKARTLTQQTLDAVRPVTGSATTSADQQKWEQCSTETPGQHRFEYSYVVDLDVPKQKAEAVMEAAKAHFAQKGYVPDIPDPKTARVGATEPHSSWWVGVGVNNNKRTMFISVDSGCVFTSHDPRT